MNVFLSVIRDTKRKIILHPRTDLIKSVKIEAAIDRRASIFGQTLMLRWNVWKTNKSGTKIYIHYQNINLYLKWVSAYF